MNTNRDILLYGGLAIALASVFSLPESSFSHDGDTDKIHACVREGSGRVRFVQHDDGCGQLDPANAWTPGHWSSA